MFHPHNYSLASAFSFFLDEDGRVIVSVPFFFGRGRLSPFIVSIILVALIHYLNDLCNLLDLSKVTFLDMK